MITCLSLSKPIGKQLSEITVVKYHLNIHIVTDIHVYTLLLESFVCKCGKHVVKHSFRKRWPHELAKGNALNVIINKSKISFFSLIPSCFLAYTEHYRTDIKILPLCKDLLNQTCTLSREMCLKDDSGGYNTVYCVLYYSNTSFYYLHSQPLKSVL